MKLKLNRKGFTLVEILVVLMIVTIVMALAGSIVLSSFSLFGTATQDDVTKRSLDSLVEYVKSEITYAGDVRIASTKPEGDNWQSLDVNVDSGKLEENANSSHSAFLPVFSNAFYYGNTLDISISNFVDNKQFDIQFTFKKKNYDDYVVNVTIQFPNIGLKMKSDDTFKPFDGLNESNYLLSGDMKLYYRSGITKTEPEIDKPLSTNGTVADQINFLNNYNNREMWDQAAWYRKGDMVYYEGSWWYCLIDNATNKKLPGNFNCEWKKIDAYWNSNSGYQIGDIVIYKEEYYRAIRTIIQTNYNPVPTDKNSGNWEKLGAAGTGNVDSTLESTEYTNQFLKIVETVRNALGTSEGYEIVDEELEIHLYDAKKTYYKEDLVKVYLPGHEGDEALASYYINVFGNSLGFPPDNNSSEGQEKQFRWKRLSIAYYPNSAYLKDDRVYLNIVDGMIIEAKNNVSSVNNPKDDIDSNKGSWKQLN